MRISDWSSDVCSSDLIWRRQGAGTFIGAEPHRAEHHLKKLPEVSNMLEVMEVRLRLEPALAQLAALRATPADVASMRSLAPKVVAPDHLDGPDLDDSAIPGTTATVTANPPSTPPFEPD